MAQTHTETLIVGDTSANTLNGTTGDDVIVGYGGSDILVSNGGNDLIIGSQTGTADLDIASFGALTTGISVNLANGSVVSGSAYNSGVLIGVAGVIGTSHDDIFNATGFSTSSANHTAFGVVGTTPSTCSKAWRQRHVHRQRQYGRVL